MAGPMEIKDTSDITNVEYDEREEYLIEARLATKFMVQARTHFQERDESYRMALRHMTEAIYGEVRAEVYKLFPMTMIVARTGDREKYDEFNEILNNILEMTKP